VDGGEPADQRLGYSISQIFLGGITREVFQGQHRQGFDFRSSGIPWAVPGCNVCEGKQGN
jgi:hypothetical protein